MRRANDAAGFAAECVMADPKKRLDTMQSIEHDERPEACSKVSATQKERGQARLPNLELIRVEVVIAAGKVFNVRAIGQVQESRGPEGGLAPAL